MLNTNLTEHFTHKEIECPCCNLIPGAVLPEILEILTILERIRKNLKTPLIITSGYRCLSYNTKIQGASRSKHMDGRAIDIAYGSPRFCYELVESAINNGIGIIRVYEKHVHLETNTIYEQAKSLSIGNYRA